MRLNNDALGLVFQIIENGFAAKPCTSNLSCSMCLLDLQCSKPNLNAYVDCMCLYLFATVVVCACVLCCVCNSINTNKNMLFLDLPFIFCFSKILCAAKLSL